MEKIGRKKVKKLVDLVVEIWILFLYFNFSFYNLYVLFSYNEMCYFWNVKKWLRSKPKKYILLFILFNPG